MSLREYEMNKCVKGVSDENVILIKRVYQSFPQALAYTHALFMV